MRYWLVMKMSRWSELTPSISIGAEPNCIGFLPIFTDYDDALRFSNNDADYIKQIDADEPAKPKLKRIK